MPKYIYKLRRGRKETDTNGNVIRDDWAKYTREKPQEAIPHEGELVLEYDNGIPRLKIGDGIHSFDQLEYMSVDSFILPKPASVTIYPDKWVQMTDENDNLIENRYYQYVTINNAIITPNSKVDLQPKPEDLVVFHEKDLAFTAVNAGGQVRICVIGQKPTQKYTFQVTVTEVAENA
jgi:hypothetical protein